VSIEQRRMQCCSETRWLILLVRLEQETAMTVQLDWPPDVVDRLTEEARKKGLSLDAYLLEAVLADGLEWSSG
jgi:hypothetical protein